MDSFLERFNFRKSGNDQRGEVGNGRIVLRQSQTSGKMDSASCWSHPVGHFFRPSNKKSGRSSGSEPELPDAKNVFGGGNQRYVSWRRHRSGANRNLTNQVADADVIVSNRVIASMALLIPILKFEWHMF